MQTKISGFQVDFCKVADNFDCCFLFSITVASVEVWCAVVVQQKNFYYPPSPQNRCECVTTAIMFYQVARFNLIKPKRHNTVPTPPQKTDKVGDDTSSGEDNSDDEETAVETSGVSEYQVPTTPTFYQGDQAAPVGEGGGNTTEPMETNSNEV